MIMFIYNFSSCTSNKLTNNITSYVLVAILVGVIGFHIIPANQLFASTGASAAAAAAGEAAAAAAAAAGGSAAAAAAAD